MGVVKAWVALVALSLAVAGVAGASDGDKTSNADKQAAKATENGQAYVTIGGLRIAVDPKTGDLRPLTPAESKKLADAMRKKFKPRDLTAPTVRADGSLTAVVAPNVLRFSVARIGPDGRVSTICADGTKEAIESLIAATAKKPAQPEEK
jgi:hypothetical protein